MLGFVYPQLLLLLFPVVAWLVWKLRQKKTAWTIPSSMAVEGALEVSLDSDRLRTFLRALCMALLVISSARIHSGYELISEKKQALDIMLVVDTSVSMRAMDFILESERRDRLAVLKSVLQRFIGQRPDDRIGLVVFGTQAFTQSPLTSDHEALTRYLERIQVGMAGEATAIGDGLAIAIKRFEGIEANSKVVVLVTDGENNAGSLDPIASAQAAKALGVRVYTIGVGSNQPVPFPRESFFGTTYDQRIFKLDEKLLKQLAELTGGSYFLASDTQQLQRVTEQINELERTERDDQPLRLYNEFSEYLLIAGLALFCLEMLLLPRRRLP